VAGPAQRFIVTRNRVIEGLGLPLPAGRLMLFSEGGPRPILLGQGTVTDHAVGEDVEIGLGPAPGVRTQLEVVTRAKARSDYELIVTNDRAEPVRFEAEIAPGDWTLAPQPGLARRNGMSVWAVTVPAYGTSRLRYSLNWPR
jgi:hypothetical protein